MSKLNLVVGAFLGGLCGVTALASETVVMPHRPENAQASSASPALTAEQLERLKQRDLDAWEAQRLAFTLDSDEALGVARRMLQIQREVFKDSPDDVAAALEFIAEIAKRLARFDEANAALDEALNIRTKARGADDWRTIDAKYALERAKRLTSLDVAHREKYRAAQRSLSRAAKLKNYEESRKVEIEREGLALLAEALGPKHAEYAHCLDQFAKVMMPSDVNDRKKVDAIYAQAQAIRKQVLGEQHPDYALSLENRYRCVLNRNIPAWVAAGEPLLRQALELRKTTQGERHPDYARTLGFYLAALVRWKPGANRAEAMALFEQAIDIERLVYGADSGLRHNCLSRFAGLCEQMGNLARAAEVVEEIIRIRRQELAGNRWRRGDRRSMMLGPPPKSGATQFQLLWSGFAKREALASSLLFLSRIRGRQGDLPKAVRCLDEALDTIEEGFGYRAAVNSTGGHDYDERTSSTYTWVLNTFLALSLDARAMVPPAKAYRRVLARKGAFLAYERSLRRARERPELTPLFTELEAVAAEVGRRGASPPALDDSAGWRRLHESMRRKDELQVDLAARVMRTGVTDPSDITDPGRIQSVLSPDVALVDFLVVFANLPWNPVDAANQGLLGYRLLAFISRREGPIVRLDLGQIKPIEEAVDSWRTRAQAYRDPTPMATWLGERIWRPLEPHFTGIHTVLVSPDGPLCKFPMSALPGKSLGTFLIDDMAIVTVPVPRLVASDTLSMMTDSPARLLLVGDIDFAADPGKAVSSPERVERSPTGPPVIKPPRIPGFPPLPGTKREIEVIDDLFKSTHPGAQAVVLRGAAATEVAFRATVPGSRFVHLATHGFFRASPNAPRGSNPERWNSGQGLADSSPGLFAGIAFAGANRPRRSDIEDGTLTALEAQELDLSGIELMVLSACETSLGTATKGEGMLGLQRALHVAGVRSLITSLWPVDDAATSVLMEEFYANLWQRKLRPSEALRRAQIAVLDNPERVLRRNRELALKNPRGLGTTPELLSSKGESRRRSPPQWWSAFVLSVGINGPASAQESGVAP